MKTIPKPFGNRRVSSPRCLECGAATRERKSYCSEHITMAPYPAWVSKIARVQQREEERIERVGTKAIRPGSLMVKEIVKLLSTKNSNTTKSLARELHVEFETLRLYISYMKDKGIIATEPTKEKLDLFITLLANPEDFELPKFDTY